MFHRPSFESIGYRKEKKGKGFYKETNLSWHFGSRVILSTYTTILPFILTVTLSTDC